uniref:Putative secreted protein n=1 Tax=Anopheles marajoara TaxID=58244 RepID=A0A2M4CES5_9DIPT
MHRNRQRPPLHILVVLVLALDLVPFFEDWCVNRRDPANQTSYADKRRDDCDIRARLGNGCFHGMVRLT